MLMQNFKSAADLGITEPQFDALRKTLVMLETGRIRHVPVDELKESLDSHSFEDKSFDGYFNMAHSFAVANCGTVACIRGTAMMVGRVSFPACETTGALLDLFYGWAGDDPDDVQAARVLRNYLTTGKPDWKAAVA